MAADIRKVAKRARVSISTVSRVINNSGYYSVDAKEKVDDAVRALGYRQNKIAVSLRKRSSSFIGLIVPDISNEFYSMLAKYIENELIKDGYNLFLGNSEWSIKKEKQLIESLLDSQVSGIILASSSAKLPKSLIQNRIPKVFIDCDLPTTDVDNVLFVESDNYHGAKEASKCLLSSGGSSLVYLGGYINTHPLKQRKLGFLNTMKENGIDPKKYRTYKTRVSPLEASKTVKEIFSQFPFDALFCSTDTIALGALKALSEMRVLVPDSVQIIGFDGIFLGEFSQPPLTTIKQDFKQFGEIIGKNIRSMLLSEHEMKQHLVIPTTLIKRGTTK